ncbi:MAG: BON domain-containing protein [Anaerolineae bacterium]|nr:BON domain-containing protein [Anaerolineae bacterium]
MAMQGGFYGGYGYGPGWAYGPPGARYYCVDYTLANANPFRSDEDIRREIELTLVWDTWVNSDEVRVEVRDGVATLSGEVDSITAKRSAGDDAWDTVGVMDVVNNIAVRQLQPERQAQRQTQAA